MNGAKSRIIVIQMRSLELIMTYIHITSFVHTQNSQMRVGGTDLTEPHRIRFVNDKPGSRAAEPAVTRTPLLAYLRETRAPIQQHGYKPSIRMLCRIAHPISIFQHKAIPKLPFVRIKGDGCMTTSLILLVAGKNREGCFRDLSDPKLALSSTLLPLKSSFPDTVRDAEICQENVQQQGHP